MTCHAPKIKCNFCQRDLQQPIAYSLSISERVYTSYSLDIKEYVVFLCAACGKEYEAGNAVFSRL